MIKSIFRLIYGHYLYFKGISFFNFSSKQFLSIPKLLHIHACNKAFKTIVASNNSCPLRAIFLLIYQNVYNNFLTHKLYVLMNLDFFYFELRIDFL